MIDFTSAHYLGFKHASHELAPWDRLSQGTPASQRESELATATAQRLASWIGLPEAVVAPSTLHVFWDLFALLTRASNDRKPAVTFHVDAGCYAIARWGLERIEHEAPVFHFRHQNPEALKHSLNKAKRLKLEQATPIVVCDGCCTSCGQPSPLADFLQALEEYPDNPNGRLVIDDTQALGLLGSNGIGSLQAVPKKLSAERIIIVASLSKALTVPLAFLAANSNVIQDFRGRAETRQHCSPPTAATLSAAQNALDLNQQQGDALRRKLMRNVEHFRAQLAKHNLKTSGGTGWPFRVLTLPASKDADVVHEHLRSQGVHCARLNDLESQGRLGFLLTANHKQDELDRAVDALAWSCRELVGGEMPEIVLLCDRL